MTTDPLSKVEPYHARVRLDVSASMADTYGLPAGGSGGPSTLTPYLPSYLLPLTLLTLPPNLPPRLSIKMLLRFTIEERNCLPCDCGPSVESGAVPCQGEAGCLGVQGGHVWPTRGWLRGSLHTQARCGRVIPHLVLDEDLVLAGVVGPEAGEDQGGLAGVGLDGDPLPVSRQADSSVLDPGHPGLGVAKIMCPARDYS